MTTAGATALLSPEKTRSVCHVQEGLSFSQRSPLALGPYMLLYTQSGAAKPPTFLGGGGGGQHAGKGRARSEAHAFVRCGSVTQEETPVPACVSVEMHARCRASSALEWCRGQQTQGHSFRLHSSLFSSLSRPQLRAHFSVFRPAVWETCW